MWDMKEWFLKFVVHAVWRRRKGLYYALSLISIVGNVVVLVGPSLQASIESCYDALYAVWGILSQAAEMVLHRSVLYILLNLIVLRIMVKSGVLDRTSVASMKADGFCQTSSYFWTCIGLPIEADMIRPSGSTYHGVRGTPWPASNTNSMCSAQATVDARASSGQSMLFQQAHSDCKCTVTSTNVGVRSLNVGGAMLINVGTMLTDMCGTSCTLQHRNNHTSCDNDQTKYTAVPSLFTIEPLNEPLQEATERQTLDDDQSDAHMSKTPEHRLHKVISRADLRMSVHARGESPKDFMRAELPQQRNEQSAHGVGAVKKHGTSQGMTCAGEHDDNDLSRQEFNERVDTFISKFKRNLTMQRQASLNRLLGLVGGGGEMIRLIK